MSASDDRLFHRRDAASSGLDDWDLRVAHRDGRIDRVYRGFYLPADDDPSVSGHDARSARYRARVLAAVANGRSDKIVSHHSAAVLHGLPLLTEDDGVHFTVSRSSGGRKSGRANHLHPADVDPAEIVHHGRVAVTSLARTAVDVARAGSFADAICVLDSALRAGVSPAEIGQVLRRSRGRTGIGTARRAAAFADGRSESVGESVSRAIMIALGVPMPALQREFRSPDGAFVARVDFDWDGRLVGEFDGRAKYGLSEDAVWREKRREDALRDMGIVVVRWVWSDLMDPARMHAIVRRGLERAGVSAAA